MIADIYIGSPDIILLCMCSHSREPQLDRVETFIVGTLVCFAERQRSAFQQGIRLRKREASFIFILGSKLLEPFTNGKLVKSFHQCENSHTSINLFIISGSQIISGEQLSPPTNLYGKTISSI